MDLFQWVFDRLERVARAPRRGRELYLELLCATVVTLPRFALYPVEDLLRSASTFFLEHGEVGTVMETELVRVEVAGQITRVVETGSGTTTQVVLEQGPMRVVLGWSRDPQEARDEAAGVLLGLYNCLPRVTLQVMDPLPVSQDVAQ